MGVRGRRAGAASRSGGPWGWGNVLWHIGHHDTELPCPVKASCVLMRDPGPFSVAMRGT